MKTATGFEVHRIQHEFNFTDRVIWSVDPPIRYDDEGNTTTYVVSSATNVLFSGPETYIFPCDKKGEWLSNTELPGSYRGGFDHDKAINHINHREIY